jgi:hypothetical protein
MTRFPKRNQLQQEKAEIIQHENQSQKKRKFKSSD